MKCVCNVFTRTMQDLTQECNSSLDQEAYLSKGVVVEGAAVVLALRRALRPALLDVRHEADVGVREGQVGAGPIHVLAVVRNCGK